VAAKAVQLPAARTSVTVSAPVSSTPGAAMAVIKQLNSAKRTVSGIMTAVARLGKVVVFHTEFNSVEYLREKMAEIVKDALRSCSLPQA
jgi:hypothetical protein